MRLTCKRVVAVASGLGVNMAWRRWSKSMLGPLLVILNMNSLVADSGREEKETSKIMWAWSDLQFQRCFPLSSGVMFIRQDS